MTIEEFHPHASRVFTSCVDELIRAGSLMPGSVVVLGCSTSEIAGAAIGKGSLPALGPVVAQAMISACRERGLEPAFQCCEHLNRALVMEQRVLTQRSLTQVRAIPQPKAGGSVPAAAWKLLDSPALAMSIQAEAAIDVGDTLVGMHIRPVAVPLRGEFSRLGQANLVMAYSRLPYIGGARAVYEEPEAAPDEKASPAEPCFPALSDWPSIQPFGLLLRAGAELALAEGFVSASLIQRRFSIGYALAGRILDELERLGVVSAKGERPTRRCLIDREKLAQMKRLGQL